MSELQSQTVWSSAETLRERINKHSIYYWYPGYQNSKEIYDLWTELDNDSLGLLTVSDWGLNTKDINLLDDAIDVDGATQSPRKDSYAGENLQEILNDSPNSVGQHVGTIRRFLVDFAVGTPIFVPEEGSYERVVPGVIVSEPYYEHNDEHPIRELDPHHVYYRRVDWLTDDEDEVQSIPIRALPKPYQQPPSGTGAKCTRDVDDQLLLADVLSAGQHLAESE